jgi:hypothetical protein
MCVKTSVWESGSRQAKLSPKSGFSDPDPDWESGSIQAKLSPKKGKNEEILCLKNSPEPERPL